MKTKMRLDMARDVANQLVTYFQPDCKRIEVAGSIRRCKPDVGDIEILAVPTIKLYELLDDLLSEGKIYHVTPKRWGNKLRAFRLPLKYLDDSVQVDLFLQPNPTTWGVNLMIRTGSAEFSRKMVTKRSAGGFMPDHFRIYDARVWAGAKVLETPEEEDVFRLWGMDYVLPPQRADWYTPKFGDAPVVEVEPEPVQGGLF